MIEHKHPPTLDVKHAAHASLQLSGHDFLSNFERLVLETQGQGGENPLNWSAKFEFRSDHAGAESVWLDLKTDTCLPLVCQRCMTPVDVVVSVDRCFRFVETEAVALAQDDESEEDLLVIGREFDLGALFEDEVLMDLPLVPRHETCPVKVKLTAADTDFEVVTEKPNPFALLAQLKSDPS